MTPAEIKTIMEIAAAGGVPGTIVIVLIITYYRNREDRKDPASEVLASLEKMNASLAGLNSTVDAIDTRLTRVETRQDMMLDHRIQHFTDRTTPPR